MSLSTKIGSWTLALFALVACRADEKAAVPVYLNIDKIHLATDYDEEGTAHSDISTVWISDRLGKLHGVYELPVIAPLILPEGESEITLESGINTNGIRSFRSINDAFENIRLTIPSGSEGDTLNFADTELSTGYNNRFRVVVVEDFNSPGLNLSRGSQSDTGIFKIDHADSIFTFTPVGASQPENNRNSGMIVLNERNSRVSLASVVAYNIPQGAQNLYLEVTYRSNVNISFGVVAEFTNSEEPALTATLFPKKEWSKIYINLITEVNAFRAASGYKVLIVAQKPEEVPEGRIFLDHIKLVFE